MSSRDPVYIDVGKDYSMTPGGRYRSEGDWSGEEFRQNVLEPKLDTGLDLIVDLDGPFGFTSSFLEEVFGGLVRKYGPSIRKRVEIQAIRKPTRKEKAEMYVDRAVRNYRR